MSRRKPEPQSSKLDEPVSVSADKALENLDRVFAQVINVSNKTVQQKIRHAKKRNLAKRGRRTGR